MRGPRASFLLTLAAAETGVRLLSPRDAPSSPVPADIHAHFSAEGVADYYTAADFHIHALSEIDDCFQFDGSSREAALMEAIEFMGGAYGLEKLEKSPDGTNFLWEKIQQIFPVDETPAARDSSASSPANPSIPNPLAQYRSISLRVRNAGMPTLTCAWHWNSRFEI